MNEQTFDGATFEQERDGARLTAQLQRVKALMLDGRWRTHRDICDATGDKCMTSISARVRDLRKPQFGGFRVERSYVGDGVFMYRVSERAQ